MQNHILIDINVFLFRRNIQGFLQGRSPKPQPCLGLRWKSLFVSVPSIPGRWTWTPSASFTCKATLQVSSALARTHRHIKQPFITLCMAWIIPACTLVLARLVWDVWCPTQAPSWPSFPALSWETLAWANWMVDSWGQTVWKRIKGLQSESPSLKGAACLGSLCEKRWVGSYWEATGSPAWPAKAPVHSYFCTQLAFRKDECHLAVYGLHKESIKAVYISWFTWAKSWKFKFFNIYISKL